MNKASNRVSNELDLYFHPEDPRQALQAAVCKGFNITPATATYEELLVAARFYIQWAATHPLYTWDQEELTAAISLTYAVEEIKQQVELEDAVEELW